MAAAREEMDALDDFRRCRHRCRGHLISAKSTTRKLVDELAAGSMSKEAEQPARRLPTSIARRSVFTGALERMSRDEAKAMAEARSQGVGLGLERRQTGRFAVPARLELKQASNSA